MREQFSKAIERAAVDDQSLVFLTGDLGFMSLENVRSAIGDRFINVGVCEQNMISMAAGLALQGLTVVCYSIAPFAVFRPAEQIRLDVCLHNLNVKIVGNGGGYGYGIMGATHHALEDLAVLSSFQNMRCFVPCFNEDVPGTVALMLSGQGPSYLRLGFGTKPDSITLPPFQQFRKLVEGKELTVATIGPIVLNVLTALQNEPAFQGSLDLFTLSELPINHLSSEFAASLRRTGKLLVVEEHVARGGLGENLARMILLQGSLCRFDHLYALGYPGGLYGSQPYHQKMSGLDPQSIAQKIRELLHAT